MVLNVDVICSETGEVLKEGILLANAHIYIAKRDGKILSDDVDVIDLDDIDEGGQIEIRSLHVRFPDVVNQLKEYHNRMKKASEFWNYQAKSYIEACGGTWKEGESNESL
jgi:hypothetical protein